MVGAHRLLGSCELGTLRARRAAWRGALAMLPMTGWYCLGMECRPAVMTKSWLYSTWCLHNRTTSTEPAHNLSAPGRGASIACLTSVVAMVGAQAGAATALAAAVLPPSRVARPVAIEVARRHVR